MLFASSRRKVLIAVMGAALLSACTTASYGLKPDAVENQQDTYKFKVYVGGFSGGETADKSVKPDLNAYQNKNGFKRYEVVDRSYNFIPSYFEYTVHFFRE